MRWIEDTIRKPRRLYAALFCVAMAAAVWCAYKLGTVKSGRDALVVVAAFLTGAWATSALDLRG
jgi:hypothetical protein